MKKYPNSFLMLIALILVSCALTWLIPAGSYARAAGESGASASVGQFSYGEPTPVSPLALPGYIVDGFAKNVDLILVLLFSGGAFSLVNTSGALQALIHGIAAKCQKRRLLLLILLTSAFALICSCLLYTSPPPGREGTARPHPSAGRSASCESLFRLQNGLKPKRAGPG